MSKAHHAISCQDALPVCSLFHRKCPRAIRCFKRRQTTVNCTANHCGEITKAIKTLETKVDNLIALVKDALPPKPSGSFSMIFWDTAFNVFIFQVFSTR